mmetsp:Transcript_19491/g.58087  ORF Transcript_19491/g.58087 Transcript_19491/m.58087 type:complete len:95 (+) Transcript_19491:313-597(+)
MHEAAVPAAMVIETETRTIFANATVATIAIATAVIETHIHDTKSCSTLAALTTAAKRLPTHVAAHGITAVPIVAVSGEVRLRGAVNGNQPATPL